VLNLFFIEINMQEYGQQGHQDSDSHHDQEEAASESSHQDLPGVENERQVVSAHRLRSLVDLDSHLRLLALHSALSPRETPCWKVERWSLKLPLQL
jgi:hypothetical protein